MKAGSSNQGQFSLSQEGDKITIQVTFSVDAFRKSQEKSTPQEPPKKDELIFIKQCPDIARVSISTLRRMKKAGEIPYTKIRGRIFFYESTLLSIRKEIHLKGV